MLDRLRAQHQVEGASASGSGASGSSSTSRASGSRAARPLERDRATRRRRSARAASSSAVRRPSPQPRSSAPLDRAEPRTNSRSAPAAGPARRGRAPRARRRSGWPCPYPRRPTHGTGRCAPPRLADAERARRQRAARASRATATFAPPGWEPPRPLPRWLCSTQALARAGRLVRAGRGRRRARPGHVAIRPAANAADPLARARPGAPLAAVREAGLVGIRPCHELCTTRWCARRASAATPTMRLFAAAGQARARRFYEREGWTAAGPSGDRRASGCRWSEYRRAISSSV